MTPKEKAYDIADKIEGVLGHSLPTNGDPYYKETKQISLLFVDEILSIKLWAKNNGVTDKEFWSDVKAEIERLPV